MVQNDLTCLNGLIWFDIVKTVKKKVENGPIFFSKWSTKVQIHLKLFHKIIAVGVTAVWVAVVRNNI